MKTILTVKNLTMSYDRFSVLENISFEVCEGEWLSIVGENGSGKTTLLKGIAGLLPHKGEIIIDNPKGAIGYLPQQTRIQRDFPACVHEVVQSGCKRRFGFLPRAQREKAMEALRELGIADLCHRPYAELSGGQQQRVLLARALCTESRLLLLDEPVTGLDPVVSRGMYETIGRLRDKGIAVVMVSHDVSGAVKYSDKILHIGRDVEFYGTTDEYLKSTLGMEFAAVERGKK